MKRMTLLVGVLIVITLLATPSVLGIAILQDYVQDYTLLFTENEVKEGKIKTHQIRIPNAGTDAITVIFNVEESPAIYEVENLKDEYVIDPGEKVPITFHIKMPKDAKVGDEFPISFGVQEKKEGSSGGVSMSFAVGGKLNTMVGSYEDYLALTDKQKLAQGFDTQEMEDAMLKRNLMRFGIPILVVLILAIALLWGKGRKKYDEDD